MPLLGIKDLHVEFPTQGGVLHAVDGVSLTLEEGEVLGIVGESGSGKSVTMMALMGLVGFPGRVRADHMRFAGKDLLGISDKARRALVGKEVAMIFQEPTTSLNPCFTIGFQLMETLRLHLNLDKRDREETRDRAAGAGRHSRRVVAPRKLPAPALGRHEPARDDRDGHRLQPAPADRRRADHRARRHHPGADPRPAARPAEGARHGAGAHHAQHGRGERDGAAHRRDVCGPGDGAPARRPALRVAAAPVHRGLLAALPERAAPEGRLATISGVVPGVHDRPVGLPVRAALQLRHHARLQGAAGAARVAGCRGALPLSRWASRAASWRSSRDRPQVPVAEALP
jgi:dipeptide transport system ATP-binding protein